MRLFGTLFFSTISLICATQEVISDFTVNSNACSNQTLEIENSSQFASFYEWDFCIETMEETPSQSTLGTTAISDNRGFDMILQDGDWYAFATDRATNSLIKLFYGEDPTSPPVVTNYDDLGELSGPEGISVIRSDDGWHVFIGYSLLNTDAVVRVDFGSSLANDPILVTELEISGFTGTGRIWDLKAIEIDGEYFLVFPYYNRNEIVVIEFQNSFFNTIEAGDINSTNIDAGALRLFRGIDLVEFGGSWYAFILAQTGDNLTVINFGSDILATPSVINDYSFSSITNPYRIKVFQSASQHFAFVSNQSIQSAVLNISDVFASSTISEVLNNDIIQYGGFDLINFEGEFLTQGYISGTLTQLEFSNNCSASLGYNEDFEPVITYESSGRYEIELRAFDSNGSYDVFSEFIDISAQLAPSISHTSQEICISNPIAFSPSTPGLDSYDWDFDGDGMVDVSDPTGSDQLFDYSGLGTGTYTVRLDVNDGTCDNFYEEEITIYPEPPVPTFTVLNEECVNTDITFTNTTDESLHIGVISYLWDFDSDGIIDSTDPNPIFAYTTPGIKTVTLYDTIPGCRNVSATFDITINPGPTADFTASSVCEGEAMVFNNNSINADTYFWDFGDGFNSTDQTPTHLYENDGNYTVSLTATDADLCDATIQIEVAVSDTPDVNFDFEVACTSENGNPFTDLTTVNGADLISWSWRVDGEEVSTSQNPSLMFSDVGTSNVSLVVGSSNGCESSYNEDISILSAPQADFISIVNCEGESSVFEDLSVSSGNPIVSWLWFVDEGSTTTEYTTQDIDHVFSTPGSFEVTLEVTGQNFCSESLTRTVEVLQLPEVNFALQGDCENQVINAIDQTTEFNDQVISQRWTLDGQSVGNGDQLFLDNLTEGSYNLSLEVETASGCIVSNAQSILINDAPEASFSFDRFYGIPNDQLSFTNTSTGNSSFQWLLNGEPVTSTQSTQAFLFPESGTHEVALVARNDLGCNDTIRQEVIIAVPEVDLRIGSFDLVQEGTVGRIFLEIENQSNLPIEVTDVQVELENQFSVNEQVEQFVNIGETQLVGLNVGIPLEVSQPTYFCVTLTSQYSIESGTGEEFYPDITPVDNEKCLTIEPSIVVEDPFPNPVSDQFRLKVVVPEEGSVNVRLINSAGKLESENTFQSSAGLNNFFVEMTSLRPGIYFVTVQIGSQGYKRKIIKL